MEHLYNKLIEYGASDYYPYHMPGHKRRLNGNLAKVFFDIDITEIPGFDDLHHPEEIIEELQKKASKMYDSDETFYLVNGSSCGVMAAICGVLNKKDKIIMARNCHKSAYYAAFMHELEIAYVFPQNIPGTSILEAVSLEDIEKVYCENTDAKAIIIVSPTYEGRISNIKEIAAFAHSKNIPLIVDEAHGAHLGFSECVCENSNRLGADVVIMSVHKTLPAFTQSALLHINGNLVKRDKIKKYLDIYQTSSPSYILMAGIDNALSVVDSEGNRLFQELYNNFVWMLGELEGCKKLKFLPKENFYNGNGNLDICRHDLGKLVICTSGADLSGQEVYDILLNKYHLQLEMAAGDYCLAMFTIGDTREAFERITKALIEIDAECACGKKEDKEINQFEQIIPQVSIPLCNAWDEEYEEVEFDQALGKVSKEFVYLYPPGVPLLVPGELITSKVIETLQGYIDLGLNIQGLFCDDKCLRVLV